MLCSRVSDLSKRGRFIFCDASVFEHETDLEHPEPLHQKALADGERAKSPVTESRPAPANA
jgi:hypothetical protein